MYMKKTLLFTCVITLFTTTGCIFPEGGGRGHARGPEHYEGRSEVRAGPPVVVVRAPEVVVRPPEVIVR
jgi:hypothetical protein